MREAISAGIFYGEEMKPGQHPLVGLRSLSVIGDHRLGGIESGEIGHGHSRTVDAYPTGVLSVPEPLAGVGQKLPGLFG